MLARCLLAATLLSPLVSGQRREVEDTVWLADGSAVRGRVVYEDDEIVRVRTGSRERDLPRADVTQVDAAMNSLHEVLDRLAGFGLGGPPDVAALLELARFADHNRLPGEARLLYSWALLADPDDVEANRALGHRERRGQWSFKRNGRWRAVSGMGLPPDGWSDRSTLETLHYEVRTDLPLESAIRLAFDAERFFRAFREQLGRAVAITEPVDVMAIEAHAGSKSFPEPPDGRRGYFDEQDRIVDLLAQGDFRRDLFHELTHQALFICAEWQPRAKGEVPDWLVEGLAEAFSTGYGGPPGASTFDVASVAAEHFRVHAAAARPYDLGRVLTLQRDDFVGTTDRALKYAQSYTLLHYVWFSNDPALQRGFDAFLAAVWEGKGSPSRFRDLLDADDEDAFEKAWSAYAASKAP